MTPSLMAKIALAGKGVDLLGGCYLAYDLLDGHNGPLRGITRATVYLPLFFCGYALLLGSPFAFIAALGMAAALALEFTVAPSSSRHIPILTAVFRGGVLGGASAVPFGPGFGVLFGSLLAGGLVAGAVLGLSPAHDHGREAHDLLRRHNVLASVYRAAVAGFSAWLVGIASGIADPLLTASRIGAAIGLVSILVGVFSPRLERWVERAPSRRLGLIGLGLLGLGTVLDSVRDWMELTN